MLIREVEKLTGIKDVNIRYYEKEGLIHPERKPNGYREYSAEDVQRIRQIKTLRLLDIPIPIIKKVLSEEISLQDVMKNRLLEISEEESRIKEIKNSCETIIAEDIHISELSEEVLYGSRATWKARLDEIMKQDIDKRFIGKAFIYIVFWAILAKSLVTAWLCFPHMKVVPWANTFWKHLICMKHLSIYIFHMGSRHISPSLWNWAFDF